jgi:hypothetical protein
MPSPESLSRPCGSREVGNFTAGTGVKQQVTTISIEIVNGLRLLLEGVALTNKASLAASRPCSVQTRSSLLFERFRERLEGKIRKQCENLPSLSPLFFSR